MSAYYNEFDPFAAAWLRELIKADLIADGEVDERSITEVIASDLVGYTQCHFFAGIGGWSYALRLAGWADTRPVWTGSCPCQPFSAAGKGEGGRDDRHLWPHWARLIRECRPVTVFGEQVESAIAHGWLDLVCDDLEREGYAIGPVCLPAASVGAPHIRQRLWFVAEGVDNPVCGRRQHESSERCVDGTLRATGQAECVSGAGGEADPVIVADADSGRHDGRATATGRQAWASAGVASRSEFDQLADAAGPRRGGRRGISGGSDEQLQGSEEAIREPVLKEPSGLRPDSGMADADAAGHTRQRADSGPITTTRQQVDDRSDDVSDGWARVVWSSECNEDGECPNHTGIDYADCPCIGPTEDDVDYSDRDGILYGRRLGDTGRDRLQGRSCQILQRAGWGKERDAPRQSGDSQWADLTWLPCRDGKLRPTQPGLLPLVARVSGSVVPSGDPSEAEADASTEARVGRLRGYGNAIVAPVAAEVIMAYMDVRDAQ